MLIMSIIFFIFLVFTFVLFLFFLVFFMYFISLFYFFFFFSSRRRHTRSLRDWSSDVCSSDLTPSSRSSGPSAAKSTIPASGPASPKCSVPPPTTPPSSVRRTRSRRRCSPRSEERRVGKECRSRWSAYRQKKKEEGEDRRRARM